VIRFDHNTVLRRTPTFRASPLFAASRERYAPGWTTHDHVADPKLVRLAAEGAMPDDLRLQAGSPARPANSSRVARFLARIGRGRPG
jgi:hypothetical protein